MNLRAKPNSPDWLLPNVHRIVPAAQVRQIPWRGESTVTIYRSIRGDDPAADIRPGDWVALSRNYAAMHGGENARMLSKIVPATHVSWAGTDMNEWFYTPGVWESMGPFESQVEQLLLERAPTVLMYHGTGERNLSSILRQGLKPKGVDRAWANDPHASFISPSRASLGGVYLTNNLMTAVSSSWKGTDIQGGEKQAIVICQIQPRSLFADEDDIVRTVRDIGVIGHPSSGRSAIHLYLTQTGQGRGEDEARWKSRYDEWRNSWAEGNAAAAFVGVAEKPHPKYQQRVRQVMYDGFPAVVARQAAYGFENGWLMFGLVSERGLESLDELKTLLPSRTEGEAMFRDFMRQLTRTMKVLAQADKQSSDFNVSGRLIKPVGFSGRNRITGVFKFYDAPNGDSVIEPVYGTTPMETIRTWEQRVGKWKIAA